MASFSPLDNYKARSRGLMPTGIVIDKSCRVYVTQIPLERIERDGANAMKAEFEVYGPLESYKMFTDRSGRFVGSALCTYRNPADASMAVYCMDGVEVEGSTLHVEPAKEHGVVLLSGSSSNNPNGAQRDHSRGFLRDTRWQSARGGRAGASLLGLGGRGRGSGGGAGGAAGADSAEASTASLPDGAPAQNEEADGGSGTRFASSTPDEEGKWSHDKYQMIAEGKEMDEVLGLRRPMRGGGLGVRGRGAAPRYADHVAMAFERYIQDRDATVADKSLHPPPPAYGESLEPTAPAPTAAQDNAEAMGEIAFGEDESTAPITGQELGALPEEPKADAE